MSVSLCIFLGVIFVIAICLFLCIIHGQKMLDVPCKGMLIVDKKEENEPAMVYFQTIADPKTFKNGETIKLKVKILK